MSVMGKDGFSVFVSVFWKAKVLWVKVEQIHEYVRVRVDLPFRMREEMKLIHEGESYFFLLKQIKDDLS